MPSIFDAHQPGVATPHFDHAALAAFDVAAADRRELAALLAVWTTQADRLMGAAHGALTVTIGLGGGLFDGRFGLADKCPAGLRPLPAFPGDALDPARCHGDVGVLVAGRDAAATEQAVADLATAARLSATTRWIQRGRLLRRPGDGARGAPRDVLGFRDGMNTLRRGRDLDRHVWVRGRDRSWMLGGTFLVLRRIDVDLEAWQRLSTAGQEAVIGRQRESGAPLGAGGPYDPVPADTTAPENAHVRVAAPKRNGGATMLRRSYSFDEGGEVGLLFLAFVADPRRQYVPVQRRLAHEDALAPYLTCLASALFAVPPGACPGGFVAEPLLAA